MRASSGMIGTIRWAKPLSRSRLRNITANAMVVETDRFPEPSFELGQGLVGRSGQRTGPDHAVGE